MRALKFELLSVLAMLAFLPQWGFSFVFRPEKGAMWDPSIALIRVNMAAHVDSILAHSMKAPVHFLPDSTMMIRASGNGVQVCICPWSIDIWRHEENTTLHSTEAVVLYSPPAQ